MAWRYLTTTRREGPVAVVTFLCAGGVFTGVFALVVTLALMSGLHGDIRDRLLAANPHVEIHPRWGQPPYSLEDAARIAATAREVPGVIASSPASGTLGLMQSPASERPVPVQVKGVDPGTEVAGLRHLTSSVAWAQLAAPWQDEAGESARERAARELEASDDDDAPLDFHDLKPPPAPPMLLGKDLAASLGVSPGDLVVLVRGDVVAAPTGSAPRLSSRAFRVVGLLHVGILEYDASLAVTRLDALATPGHPASADGVELALADPLDSARVSDVVASRLGGRQVVSDWTTQFSRLFAAFRWESLIMGIALGLIGLVAGFNIFTILTLNVTARIADIGILGAVGASAASVTRVFLWMGLLLGGAGTLAGLAAGALGSWALDRWRIVELDPAVYLVSHVPFHVQPRDLVIVAAGMLIVSFLATLAPARSAARLDPVVALRSA